MPLKREEVADVVLKWINDHDISYDYTEDEIDTMVESLTNQMMALYDSTK